MIIELLESFPDEPPFFFTIASSEHDNAGPRKRGHASDFVKENSILRAQYEYYERAALANYTLLAKNNCIFSSQKALGANCIPIQNFAGLPSYYKKNFLKMNLQKREWVKISTYSDNSTKFVPVETVALRAPDLDIFPIREPSSNGAASHYVKEVAELSSILELIERDSFMKILLNMNNIKGIRPNGSINEIALNLKRYRLDCKFLSIGTLDRVNVVLALIVDRSGFGPALTAGLAAGFEVYELCRKSILEALQARFWLRNSYDKHTLPTSGVGITNSLKRGLYWWDVSKLKFVKNLLIMPESVDPGDSSADTMSVAELVEMLSDKKYTIYTVKLNTDKDEVFACKFVIPEMFPLYQDEIFKYNDSIKNCIIKNKIHFFI